MDLAERMRAALDRDMMSILGVRTSTIAEPSEPLTLDTLRRIMLKMPKQETWLSTRLCNVPHALRVEGGGENFTVAHPMFWARVEHECRRDDNPAKPANLLGNPLVFGGIPIIEIDPWEDDEPATAEWRAAHWDRLREAMETAMIQLPDWLRSAPRFSEHG